MTATKKVKDEFVKTLWWDAKEARYVYMVWNKTQLKGQPHKLPRGVNTRPDAHKHIKENKL